MNKYLNIEDESILNSWYLNNLIPENFREVQLRELHRNYICYCETNYPLSSITNNKYNPLGRNNFSYFLKILLNKDSKMKNVIIKSTKIGFVFRNLSIRKELNLIDSYAKFSVSSVKV